MWRTFAPGSGRGAVLPEKSCEPKSITSIVPCVGKANSACCYVKCLDTFMFGRSKNTCNIQYTLMLVDLCICGLYTCVTAQSWPGAHQLEQLIKGDSQYAFFRLSLNKLIKTISILPSSICCWSPGRHIGLHPLQITVLTVTQIS